MRWCRCHVSHDKAVLTANGSLPRVHRDGRQLQIWEVAEQRPHIFSSRVTHPICLLGPWALLTSLIYLFFLKKVKIKIKIFIKKKGGKCL